MKKRSEPTMRVVFHDWCVVTGRLIRCMVLSGCRFVRSHRVLVPIVGLAMGAAWMGHHEFSWIVLATQFERAVQWAFD